MSSFVSLWSHDLISLQSEDVLYSGTLDARHGWASFGYVLAGAAAASAFIFLITIGTHLTAMLYRRMISKQSDKLEEDETSLIEKN